ncbi:hypothetical protein BDW_13905 [Bdellovibrio bacteriovorus W]|nr:hypothetical protein BDW_13905 [Bdellovibrio bacteriovorus W]
MITLIDSPQMDTVEIRILIDRPVASYYWEKKNKNEILLEQVFEVFKISGNDRVGGYRSICVRGGINIEVTHSMLKILAKGEFFLKGTAWIQIRTLLNYIHKGGFFFYLTRLDICRHFLAKKCSDPLNDLKNGFWLLKTGNSFYQPELYVRDVKRSLGSYFKSTTLVISCYSKSHQIAEYLQKLKKSRIKDERRVRMENSILHFQNKFREVDGEVYRIEWRILSKVKLEAVNEVILAIQDEENFCRTVLSMIEKSHPMRNSEKVLSK